MIPGGCLLDIGGEERFVQLLMVEVCGDCALTLFFLN